MATAAIRILQGVGDAPPPPLAGALAAWVRRAGGRVHIVDPRGAPRDEGDPSWPLFVHVDGEDAVEGVPFGPGHADPELLVDPAAPVQTLDALPLRTFDGFGQQAGAFRLLAGRGDRVRPVAHVIREVVYLVEMAQLGHVVFDDDDLARYPGWIEDFTSHLAHLPWRVTWEATVQGRRRLS